MNLKVGDKIVPIHSIYDAFGQKKTEDGQDACVVIRQACIDNHISFSRIDFKDKRDELLSKHESYVIEDHDGTFDGAAPDPNKYVVKTLTDREQVQHMCRQIYAINRKKEDGFVDPQIGRVVDYDVPVDKSGHFNLGTFDLLTETGDHVYLIEALKQGAKDPLHRIVLQVITYLNMISRTKLLEEYKTAQNNKFRFKHHRQDITPAILLFEDSEARKELLHTDPNSFLGKLILKYQIRFFVLENKDEYKEYVLAE